MTGQIGKAFMDPVSVFFPIQTDRNPISYSILDQICIESRPCEAWPKILVYIYIYVYGVYGV